MNHNPWEQENPGLLVSVRNLEEARIASAANCVSIIDVKEPANGSLGCVSVDTARRIATGLPTGTTKSIALGEVVDRPLCPARGKSDWQSVDSRSVLSRFDFAKLGLSGLAGQSDWVKQWKECFDHVPAPVVRVAVAYADSWRAHSPTLDEIIESAPTVGCSVILIDTYEKSSGGLFDCLSLKELESSISRARDHHLALVLAGSLGLDDLVDACSLNPDFVGVRGAVCQHGRSSTLVREKIEAFDRHLSRTSGATARPRSIRKVAGDSNR